jgi:hypothetical protein
MKAYWGVQVFFIYNLNQQSEFPFYKLMLWLLQCLDGESSCGESPVAQIRSIGQFLLSRLFSSLISYVLRSGLLSKFVGSVMTQRRHHVFLVLTSPTDMIKDVKERETLQAQPSKRGCMSQAKLCKFTLHCPTIKHRAVLWDESFECMIRTLSFPVLLFY